MLFHHICIQTDCYEASLAFYRDVLGLRVLQETAGFHGRAYNTWLEGPGLRIELQTGKQDAQLSPARQDSCGVAHIALEVEDPAAALQTIQDRGWTAFRPKGGHILYEVCGGLLFKLTAPEGTVLEFRGPGPL